MSESKLKTFEITIGQRQVSLELGKCAVALFRHHQEVSYIAIDTSDEEDEDGTLRVFNNHSFCEWLAGYQIINQEGVIHRPVSRRDIRGSALTFREVTGWGPAVVEREKPNEAEIGQWLELNTQDIDDWGRV